MTLRTTLLAAFAYVLVIAIVILEVPLALNISRRVEAEVNAEASGQAQLVATSAADQLDRRAVLQRLVEDSARALGGRVVVVDSRGRLLVDSAGPGLRGSSYADRPEIAAALGGETAQGTRTSDSLGEELLFTAVPIVREGRRVGAIRVTQSVDAVNSEVRTDTIGLIGIGVAALLLGLGVAWLLSSALARPLGSLSMTARRVAGGDLEARAPERGSTEQREVAASFNEMTSRLQRSLEAQRDFVGNASHQLRTPLTALQLRLEAAGERSDDPEVAGELRAAEREVTRLAALLANLLTLAAAGEDAPAPVAIELAGVARSAATRWRVEIERRHRLELSGTAGPPVMSSSEDIGIILDNLIENAIRYSPAGGTITIELGAVGAATSGATQGYVAVCDEGPGIDRGESERVRGRFYRGAAGAKQPGTGLGLAIADLLAKRWRGSLELANRPEGGLRAELRLPAATAPPEPGGEADFAGSLPGGG